MLDSVLLTRQVSAFTRWRSRVGAVGVRDWLLDCGTVDWIVEGRYGPYPKSKDHKLGDSTYLWVHRVNVKT